MSAIRPVTLPLRFLLELALLAGAAVAGWRAGGGGILGVLLAVLGLAAVAAV